MVLLLGSGGELTVDMQDSELLRAYQTKSSDTAFETVVKRYVDMVYGTARRQAKDDQTAQEITQKVFCLLARKSAGLMERPSIAGWLYRATCFLAAKEMRQEARRRRREYEAVTMNELISSDPPLWEQLSPILDEVLNELPERDRLATILRYFQRKSMNEIAAVLGVSEAAAKMRVSRAIERLRQGFAKRGIACTASVLALTMSEKAASAAPVAVTPAVLARLAAGSFGASAPTLKWTESWRLMATPAMQMTAALALASLLCAGGIYSLKFRRDSTVPSSDKYAATGSSSSLSGDMLASSKAILRRSMRFASNDDDLENLIEQLKAALHAGSDKNWFDSMGPVREALDAFGGHTSAAFPALKEADQESDTEVRLRAVSGMGWIARKVPEVTPYLWEVFTNPVSSTIGLTRGDLSKPRMTNSSIPALNEMMMSVEDVAFTSLQSSHLAAKDLPVFTEFLVNPHDLNTIGRYCPEVVAKILAEDTAAAEPFVPAIEALLNHTNANVRFRAACALAKFEADTNPKVLMQIAYGLTPAPERADPTEPDFAEKRQLLKELCVENLMALETLERIGPAAMPLVPQLRQFSASVPPQMDVLKQIAFRVIGNADPDSRQHSAEVDSAVRLDQERKQWIEELRADSLTFQDLIAALPDDQRAGLAASRLGQMGQPAKPAIPALLAALIGKDDGTRNRIVEAIHSIDPTVKIDMVQWSVVGAAIDAALQAALDSSGTRSEAQNQAVLHSLQFGSNNVPLSVTQWTYKEMTDFANMLGAQDAGVRQAFIDKAIERDVKLKQLFASQP
jgi:RNA polymerase sigma factor (sigma-70 family)